MKKKTKFEENQILFSQIKFFKLKIEEEMEI